MDTNPLYDKKYEAQLLFGRGFRAGIDSREQIQKQVNALRTTQLRSVANANCA